MGSSSNRRSATRKRWGVGMDSTDDWGDDFDLSLSISKKPNKAQGAAGVGGMGGGGAMPPITKASPMSIKASPVVSHHNRDISKKLKDDHDDFLT